MQQRNDLNSRSLVLSLLLGMRRQRRPGGQLVAWCGLFGVSEGTARVALSRMVRAGELRNEDGVYALSGRLRARVVEQDFAIVPKYRDHDGQWSMYLVVAEARTAADRAALRTAFRHAHLAERREGVWLRPANLATVMPVVVAEQCESYTVRPESPRALAGALFDLSGWSTAAAACTAELRRATQQLPDPRAIAYSFEVGTRTVAHLRADPLLPSELLPSRWPGNRLRTQYQEYRAAFSDAVRNWFAAQ